tara:strand:- start:10289 stop:10486 length:198 start_codon:yes stop_codon:yes gene_type:complete
VLVRFIGEDQKELEPAPMWVTRENVPAVGDRVRAEKDDTVAYYLVVDKLWNPSGNEVYVTLQRQK